MSVAAHDWLEDKEPKWSPRMADIARTSMNHFLPVLGKHLLVDIEASDISKYQKTRLAEGASNQTVNIEVGILRQSLNGSLVPTTLLGAAGVDQYSQQ